MAEQPVGLRRERLKRKALTKRMSSLVGRFLVLFLMGVLVFWFGRQLYQFCVFQFIDTVQARNDVLEDSCAAQGLLLLQETVVRAPASGKVVPLVEDGQRVPAGGAVARLDTPPDLAAGSGRRELKSPCPGVVSYHFDGWEGTLDNASWESYDPRRLFESIEKEGSKPRQKGEVRGAGEPVFKIIDNLVNPYIFLKFEAGYEPPFEPGDLLKLTWENSGNGRLKVLSLVRKGDSFYAVGELLAARPFPLNRLMKFQVISRGCEGVVLPGSALVKSKDGTRVITKSPLGLSLKKVDVVAAVGDHVAVKGVDAGIKVVTNPGLAKMIMKEI